MAKAEFLRTIKKNIPFVNLSTTFIFLAIIFILSIVAFFIFNKQHIYENFVDTKTTEKQTSSSKQPFSTQAPATQATARRAPSQPVTSQPPSK